MAVMEKKSSLAHDDAHVQAEAVQAVNLDWSRRHRLLCFGIECSRGSRQPVQGGKVRDLDRPSEEVSDVSREKLSLVNCAFGWHGSFLRCVARIIFYP